MCTMFDCKALEFHHILCVLIMAVVQGVSASAGMTEAKFYKSSVNETCVSDSVPVIQSYTVRSRTWCCKECSVSPLCAAVQVNTNTANCIECVLLGEEYYRCDPQMTQGPASHYMKMACLQGGSLNADNTCVCPSGYTGTYCEEEDELCPGSLCEGYCVNYGTCICTEGHLSCVCYAGYSGETCDMVGSPVTGELLYVTNGFYTGEWAPVDYCDTGTYAYAFDQKVDDDTWDELSVVEIRLYCKHPISGAASTNIPYSNSFIEDWGAWEGVTSCPSDYWIVGFRLFVEPGGGDDSAVNNMEVLCGGPGMDGTDTQIRTGTGLEFGDGATWGSWSSSCPAGTAVCGLQTKVLQIQGTFSDDDGLTDVKLQCCVYEQGAMDIPV